VDPLNTRWHRLSQWFRGVNPWAIDAVMGTLFTGLGLVGLFTKTNPADHYRDPDALAVLLALFCAVPYFFRRRAPLAVFLISVSALVLLSIRDYPSQAQAQTLIVGTFTVGSHSAGIKRATAVAAIGLSFLIIAIAGIPETNGGNLISSIAIFMASYFFGSTVRNRRLYMQQLEERAATAELEKDEEAKRAVANERLRIAQDLHDVVAHSMGVIAVQAGVGAHVIDNDPAEAKKSLEAIATTSRSTLTEIRRMLGVLREDEAAQYAPAPGLADLDRLVSDVGAAGLDVNVETEGDSTNLPPGVDFTAYRIVQESLTNVLKHAGPAHAYVRLDFEPTTLRIEVCDDGRGVNGRAQAGGHGLLGMRERVGVYGGEFDAGPRAGGGYRVAVTLPYGEAESE
jgi:signal transduction histidine kinase